MRLQSIVFMGMLALGLLSSATLPGLAYAEQPTESTSFVDVNVTSSNFPNDQPFAISCDPNAVYMTIYNSGNLAKIDPVTKNATIIQNPEGNSTQPRHWYSMTQDSSGNYWINEITSGRLWRYDPTGNGTWTSYPTLPQLNDSAISYPLGYVEHPNAIRVSTQTSGFHTFIFGLGNFGDLIFANNAIWMGISYDLQFDDESHAAGVFDRSFAGLLKIDLGTNSTTWLQITGAVTPTGLSIDKTDSNIMWVTDRNAQSVYKFNLSTGNVEETYTLPADSNPKGVANDDDNVYVAMNQDGFRFLDGGKNSTITQIPKASGNQTIIDTNAPIKITGSGTFTVYVVGDYLIWTDLSGHVGSINLTNGAKTYVSTTYANENHFGCQLGDDFWVAGHGSVKAGIIPMSELSPTLPQSQQQQSQQVVDSDTQKSIDRLFNAPIQSALDDCMNLTKIEPASEPYDYFHHGTRTYAEYAQYKYVLSTRSNPIFQNLTELQQAWLFQQIKPQLDIAFAWIRDG